MVSLALPNDLHCQVTLDAAAAGKHIVCEKPLCRTLEEADRMIEACHQQGVLLLYAEELLFAPKYVRARQLAEEGALGNPFLVKQWEEHDGPHMPWFWDVNRSGGGVMLFGRSGCRSDPSSGLLEDLSELEDQSGGDLVSFDLGHGFVDAV